MSIYTVNILFFGFSAFFISFLILLKRRDEIARRWAYFSMFVAMYAMGYAVTTNNSVVTEDALWAARFECGSAVFIPVTWLYFLCGFLKIERKKILFFTWLITWFIAVTIPTRLFVPSVSFSNGFSHFPEPGPSYHFHVINFFCVVSYGFLLIIRSYFKSTGETRKEIFSLFIATIFGYIGGGSQFSLIYFREEAIDLSFLLPTYPFLMAYVMIKHRVLDVEKLADVFQREKLAAIGILAASANHELKNPLYVARGTMESFLQNVEDGVYKDGESEQAAKKAIETSLHQLTRASEIMQRLTDFAKPYTGKEHLERVPLAGLIENVIELARSQFDLNKIKLSKQVDNGLAVLGNRRQLEEIFFNLIINACQAMKNGGKLTVRAEQRNGRIEVGIEDEGPGIPPNQVNKIFEPFYTTKESGTGLGLYITKQLVERNHGTIKIQSKVGKGTTFILTFRIPERSRRTLKGSSPTSLPEVQFAGEETAAEL